MRNPNIDLTHSECRQDRRHDSLPVQLCVGRFEWQDQCTIISRCKEASIHKSRLNCAGGTSDQNGRVLLSCDSTTDIAFIFAVRLHVCFVFVTSRVRLDLNLAAEVAASCYDDGPTAIRRIRGIYMYRCMYQKGSPTMMICPRRRRNAGGPEADVRFSSVRRALMMLTASEVNSFATCRPCGDHFHSREGSNNSKEPGPLEGGPSADQSRLGAGEFFQDPLGC